MQPRRYISSVNLVSLLVIASASLAVSFPSSHHSSDEANVGAGTSAAFADRLATQLDRLEDVDTIVREKLESHLREKYLKYLQIARGIKVGKDSQILTRLVTNYARIPILHATLTIAAAEMLAEFNDNSLRYAGTSDSPRSVSSASSAESFKSAASLSAISKTFSESGISRPSRKHFMRDDSPDHHKQPSDDEEVSDVASESDELHFELFEAAKTYLNTRIYQAVNEFETAINVENDKIVDYYVAHAAQDETRELMGEDGQVLAKTVEEFYQFSLAETKFRQQKEEESYNEYDANLQNIAALAENHPEAGIVRKYRFTDKESVAGLFERSADLDLDFKLHTQDDTEFGFKSLIKAYLSQTSFLTHDYSNHVVDYTTSKQNPSYEPNQSEFFDVNLHKLLASHESYSPSGSKTNVASSSGPNISNLKAVIREILNKATTVSADSRINTPMDTKDIFNFYSNLQFIQELSKLKRRLYELILARAEETTAEVTVRGNIANFARSLLKLIDNEGSSARPKVRYSSDIVPFNDLDIIERMLDIFKNHQEYLVAEANLIAKFSTYNKVNQIKSIVSTTLNNLISVDSYIKTPQFSQEMLDRLHSEAHKLRLNMRAMLAKLTDEQLSYLAAFDVEGLEHYYKALINYPTKSTLINEFVVTLRPSNTIQSHDLGDIIPRIEHLVQSRSSPTLERASSFSL